MLREMQATPDTPTIKALEVLLDRVFHRIYAGIDVDEAGVQRLRDLNRDGSLVLLPSHKSHVDYLVLSYLFNERNLQLPVIAAGDNLSFFPLGPILRRAGGFFIRRSFRGDKLYSATVEAYVRRLMRDGHTIELFIEGGRSRTGKLLTPKFGLLGMLVDAALNVTSREVHFVPISIGYERIVETGAYEKELSGGDKEKEDAAGLFKSTEVLRHKYGRISVQIGQSLSLRDLRREVGLADDAEASPPKRRAIVIRLANRTMDEINRVTAVTPGALTALALLSDRTRLLPHEEMIVRCARLLDALRAMGARVTTRTASRAGVLREEAIREAAQMFLDAELLEAHGAEGARAEKAGPGVAYRIPDRKRLELETSKNHIVHFFVERGLIAIAMLVPPGPPVEVTAVRERVRSLSKLFKHEFRFRADASFDQIFEATIAAMERDRDLTVAEGRLVPGAGRGGWSGEVWLRTYAWTLRNFVEGYRVAARSLGALRKGPVSEKDAIKRALAVGGRMAASGEVELRESVSKSVIQNAYQAFVDEGYVRTHEGKHELTESFRSPEALSAIEGRIAGFLRIVGDEDTPARG
jgi:glycerol-3-phosphate O-acyltransferase